MADRDLGSTVVVRMDASILICHSDKEQAAGTSHLWPPPADGLVRYSIGFNLDQRARTAITTVPQGAWPAV